MKTPLLILLICMTLTAPVGAQTKKKGKADAAPVLTPIPTNRAALSPTALFQVQQKRKQEISAALARGGLITGMTTDEVRAAWGAPASTSRTSSSGGSVENWGYPTVRGPGYSRSARVTFGNGLVASWEIYEATQTIPKSARGPSKINLR